MDEELLTANMFGKRLRPQITERRVRKLCEQGRIPGAQKIGRSWVIPALSAKLDNRKLKHRGKV